jgi:formate dehydrogenase maturation protein FdhE
MFGYARILEELQRRATDQPELAQPESFFKSLLSAQSRAEPRHCTSAMLAQDVTARLQAGQPILAPETFRADSVVLATLCHRVSILTAAYRPELAPACDAIRTWLCAEQGAILNYATSYLDTGRVRQGEKAGLDSALLAFVFNQALHPFLRKYARTLTPFVDESIWFRPYCPVCGGEPDFAALARGTGARRLLCSRCDFEWAFWRGTCPFCGCDDSEPQKHLDMGDRMYRLYLCERCHRYLKTIDLRESAEERLLPVERILTLSMDLAARQVGYTVASYDVSVIL